MVTSGYTNGYIRWSNGYLGHTTSNFGYRNDSCVEYKWLPQIYKWLTQIYKDLPQIYKGCHHIPQLPGLPQINTDKCYFRVYCTNCDLRRTHGSSGIEMIAVRCTMQMITSGIQRVTPGCTNDYSKIYKWLPQILTWLLQDIQAATFNG